MAPDLDAACAAVADALTNGEHRRVADLVSAALASGATARELLQRGLLAGMAVVGGRFRDGEIFLPDVLLAARAMHAGLDLLRPVLAAHDTAGSGRVVLGTVRGDLHDIGKNLVGILLEGAGLSILDLGKDVPAERFVDAAGEWGAQVIGMSALLTTTMGRMRDVVELVRERGLAGQVATLVGGAPVTPAFAKEIGADAYAADASEAVARVQALLAR